ncbi:MAG: flagellar biosynthetic protein FliO [Planctomycetota bacterium]
MTESGRDARRAFGATRTAACCRAGRLLGAAWLIVAAVLGGLTSGQEAAPETAKPVSVDSGRTVGDSLERASTPSSPATDEARARVGRITAGDYFRVLGWLLVVVVLAVGTIAGLRRLQRGAGGERAGRLMEVVGRTALTSKHQLAAVRVGERLLIVGISPDGVHGISEITDPREVVPLTVRGGFSRAMNVALDPAAAHEPDEVQLATHRREIHKLKRMVGNWRGSRPGSERPE